MARQKKDNTNTTEPIVETPVVQEPVVEEQAPAEVEVTETAEATVPEAPTPTLLSSGKWAYGPTTTIHCCDCGKERIIKIQDAFQVIRCADCQKKAQNSKRAAKKKEANRQASLEKRLADARALLAEHGELKAKEE